MDSHHSEPFDEVPSVETPEDVAVLYSWANLHGAKYRDFSASRREYRAQLRHRAAEQVRDGEMRAQADDESIATVAEQDAQRVEQSAQTQQMKGEAQHLQILHDAERAAQMAAAERMEAARRAESIAQTEAAARREEYEIAQASASARRQAALYIEADSRPKRAQVISPEDADVPGKISDPYTPEIRTETADKDERGAPSPMEAPVEFHPNRLRAERIRSVPPAESSPQTRSSLPDTVPHEAVGTAPTLSPAPRPVTPRRPQGYRPDDASGVRQIYRPELDSTPDMKPAPRQVTSSLSRVASKPVPPYATRETTLPRLEARSDEPDLTARVWTPAPTTPPATAAAPARQMLWANSAPAATSQLSRSTEGVAPARRQPIAASPAPLQERRSAAPQVREETAGQMEDPTPKRRRQDLANYRPTDSDRAIAAYRREQAQPSAYANAPTARPVPELRATPEVWSPRTDEVLPANSPRTTDLVGPAWIYAQGAPEAEEQQKPGGTAAPTVVAASMPDIADSQQSVSDTLQRSRERVASRWYALKGVFEQVGQERQETAPIRQKETRTPVLAVFSLAGGVGKTSLVATLGRSLSSLGEKVLLTDTTSHGLLPYYFGASELRQGTVRTFSPPSGSTDAPIYLVNYGVDQDAGDEASQEALIEEIAGNGRGTHRIMLDLTSSTSWLIRRMARLNPTVLVPVAPDMNSVISLQALEKFFHGVNGADGTPLKFFYVLNQFDAALPLHLDVREVLRRQLGERLLPFVIRRAPAVSEALAEGMTIIDYSPDAPVAEDYMTLATWLRAQSAPATAGFRNVRWSER